MIKRYIPKIHSNGHTAEMVEDEFGDWHAYGDLSDVQDERDTLLDALLSLCENLTTAISREDSPLAKLIQGLVAGGTAQGRLAVIARREEIHDE